MITAEKSPVIPEQRITVFGFVLDSVSMTITLTDENKAKVKASCQAMQRKHETTVTSLTSYTP